MTSPLSSLLSSWCHTHSISLSSSSLLLLSTHLSLVLLDLIRRAGHVSIRRLRARVSGTEHELISVLDMNTEKKKEQKKSLGREKEEELDG